MRPRYYLVLLFLIVFAGYSHGAQAWTHGNAGLTCPAADGSSAATPNTAAQFPNTLTGDFGVTYTHNILTDLGCKVAGVHYAVGLSSTQSLVVPTSGNVPAGCSMAGSVVTCSGAFTFSGFDMTNLQLSVSSSSSNFHITENKFFVGAACRVPIVIGSTPGNHTIDYNSFDGGGSLCSGTISVILDDHLRPTAGSSVIIQYNDFENIPDDSIDLAGPSSGSIAPQIKYNLFGLTGWNGPGPPHPDSIQLGGGNFNGLTINFNTWRAWYFSGNQINQPAHIEAQLTSAISNTVESYNTFVEAQSSNGTGSVTCPSTFPTACSVNEVMACKNDGAGNSNTGFSAYGNYIDWRGALTPLLSDASGGCTSTTWGSPQSNWDMFNNVALTTHP